MASASKNEMEKFHFQCAFRSLFLRSPVRHHKTHVAAGVSATRKWKSSNLLHIKSILMRMRCIIAYWRHWFMTGIILTTQCFHPDSMPGTDSRGRGTIECCTTINAQYMGLFSEYYQSEIFKWKFMIISDRWIVQYREDASLKWYLELLSSKRLHMNKGCPFNRLHVECFCGTNRVVDLTVATAGFSTCILGLSHTLSFERSDSHFRSP